MSTSARTRTSTRDCGSPKIDQKQNKQTLGVWTRSHWLWLSLLLLLVFLIPSLSSHTILPSSLPYFNKSSHSLQSAAPLKDWISPRINLENMENTQHTNSESWTNIHNLQQILWIMSYVLFTRRVGEFSLHFTYIRTHRTQRDNQLSLYSMRQLIPTSMTIGLTRMNRAT